MVLVEACHIILVCVGRLNSTPNICACAVGLGIKYTHRRKMAKDTDNSLYPIAVLIDELRNDDVQVKGNWAAGVGGEFGSLYEGRLSLWGSTCEV